MEPSLLQEMGSTVRNHFTRAFLALGVAGMLAGVSPVRAATPEAGSIEERAEKSTWDKVGIGLFGWSRGNGLSNWNGRRPKQDGSAGDIVEVVNQVSVTYPSGLGLDFIVMPQFKIRPMLSTSSNGAFELMDPTVGLVGTVYSSGGLTWWARFDNAIPISSGSRKDGKVLNPGAVNSVSYRFASSGWELQTLLVPSLSVFDNGDLSSFLYISPRLNYHLSSTVMLFGILETYNETKRATRLFNYTSADASNLGVGVKVNFSDLFVQPFLNIYPFGSKIDASTAFVGLFFGGKLK